MSICEQLELPVDSRERVLYTVKATQYHNDSGNVAIIGDSAHATYPSPGGGLNSGLEDVMCVIDCLCKQDELRKMALIKYSEQRVPV